MLNNVFTVLNIYTGYQFSNGNADLDLYIDVNLSLLDTNGLLTASDDPSYISREVFFQFMESYDGSTYETVLETIEGGTGVTYINYDSTTSRVDYTNSSSLDGLQFVQSYDATTDASTLVSGTAGADKWQVIQDGTEVQTTS